MQRRDPDWSRANKVKLLNKWKNHKNSTMKRAKPENAIVETWKTFTKQTSFHAVHYLTEKSISLFEKFLWAFAIIFAFVVMTYSCLLLASRFRSSITSTVFETTNYKVSEVPFPGVTVCNNNRLDYNKTGAAIEKFFPNQSSEHTKTFVEFLNIWQNLEFGSYDEYAAIEFKNVTKMDKLNVSEIYEFMMHDCEDFFVSCWWHRMEFNCCKGFSKQKSEYGICWSFNSVSSVEHKGGYNASIFPRRISEHGPNSALKMITNTHPETSIDRSEFANCNPGIMVVIHNPFVYPRNSLFIAASSIVSLSIKPTAYSASEGVSSLPPEIRQCYYNHEVEKYNLMHLQGLPFMTSNCMSECRQRYMMKFCNCSVAFQFPAVNYPECNVSGLICLIKHNDFINAEKPQTINEFFGEDDEGIVCHCLPECSRVDYTYEITPIYDEKPIDKDFVLVDVHFGSGTMVKYRTDVTFTGMDLIVGFGGIVSLFLGASLLSVAEIFYHATIGFLFNRRRIKISHEIKEKRIKARFPFVH